MRHETHTCSVNAKAENLWDYLMDLDSVLRLGDPDDYAVREEVPGHPERVRYRCHLHWEGIAAVYDTHLLGAHRPTLIEWQAQLFAGHSLVTAQLAPVSGKTNLTLRLEHSTAENSAPLEPFAWAIIVPKFRRAAQALSRLKL